MSAQNDLITQDDLNNLIGKRVLDILRSGKLIPFSKGSQIPYEDQGYIVGAWDIAKHPHSVGSILRVGFSEGGMLDKELKYVFLMEMK